MLIEYEVGKIKKRLLNTTRGGLAGLLGLAGTYGISPNIISAEPLAYPSTKSLDYSPRYSLDPYTQCGGEGYLDNETVLVTPQEDETLTSESLGIIPSECGNPEELINPELTLQSEPQPVPTPVPAATATPVPPSPTRTPLPIPPPPKSPIPLPTVSNVQKIPQIKGDATCIDQTNRALNLLRDKAPVYYNLVVNYLGIIECVEQGSMEFSEENPPRAVFGKEDKGNSTEDIMWYASGLTHEACHSWQYQRYYKFYPSISWKSISGSELRDLELECGEVQYDALAKLGASADFLKAFRQQLNTEWWR